MLTILLPISIVDINRSYLSARVTASAATPCKTVYVGGMSAGFTLKTGGSQIIGLSEIYTENGAISPASRAGLRAGDKIKKAGGIRIETIKEKPVIYVSNEAFRIEPLLVTPAVAAPMLLVLLIHLLVKYREPPKQTPPKKTEEETPPQEGDTT